MHAAIQDIVKQVKRLATPVAEEEGVEIWSVDFRPAAGRWILRFALDREGGITLDDLTRVHRQLSDLLDAHDPVPWRYTLEVSSPGVNRQLLLPTHYRRYLGKRVRIQTRTAQQGRRVFIGALEEVGERQVVIQDSDVGEVRIPWEEVLRATTEHDFPISAHKKKQGLPR